MTQTSLPPTSDHSLVEDSQAFVLGTSLAALSVQMLGHLGLITGQTAGLAVLLSYMTGAPFALTFFVINIPFYVLGWLRMGPRFTLRTFVAVALVSAISLILPDVISFDTLHPAVGAAYAGAFAGIGLLVLFRHATSLGGVGIAALYVQDRLGIRAGWVQLGFDAVLFAAAFFVIGGSAVAYSLLGAVITNVIIAVNHRPDRYTGR